MVKVAVLGHGTVGSGVVELFTKNAKSITSRAGQEMEVKKILDIREFPELPYADKFTKDFNDILNDPEISIVAEVMGGLSPAFEFTKALLESGKSVVTSNKELVAAKGAELLKIAAENNANFLFEASVGGGIPVLRPISQCLAANEITEISGILNGTTNYILNKMIVENMDFDSALALAQKKGFAEKNPAADIEGHDACRKICILAALAFGKHVYPEQVKTEGITDITLDDAEYADSFGCTIKLIGHAKRLGNGKITASVRPTLVSRDCILSDVNGVFNAIMIKGDETGNVMFYGKGAGKEATASAVVADILDCVKHIDTRKYVSWEEGSADYVDNCSDEPVRLFVLLSGDDFDGLVSEVENAFPGVSCIKNKFRNETAFLTNAEKPSEMLKKLAAFKNIRSRKILNTMI